MGDQTQAWFSKKVKFVSAVLFLFLLIGIVIAVTVPSDFQSSMLASNGIAKAQLVIGKDSPWKTEDIESAEIIRNAVKTYLGPPLDIVDEDTSSSTMNHVEINGPIANSHVSTLVTLGLSKVDWFNSNGDIEVVSGHPASGYYAIIVGGKDESATRAAAQALADAIAIGGVGTYDVGVSISSISTTPGGVASVNVIVENTGTETINEGIVYLYTTRNPYEPNSYWADVYDFYTKFGPLDPGESKQFSFNINVKSTAQPSSYEFYVVVKWKEAGKTTYTGKSFKWFLTVTSPPKGAISVSSTPSGAKVYLDGLLKGATPLVISDVSLGEHIIRISKEGYEDWIASRYIRGGETTYITISLTSKTGVISISSNPAGADVYIDGRFKGITPLTISGVSTGFHKIEIQKSGYEEYSTSVSVNAGEETKLSVILQSISLPKSEIKEKPEQAIETEQSVNCIIDLSSSPSAFLYIDGELAGKTPVKKEVSCGKYFLKITKEDYESWEKIVELSKDSPKYENTITLSPTQGIKFSGYELEQKYLAIIPIIVGALGFFIKLFRG